MKKRVESSLSSSKMTSNCPECGHGVESVTDLDGSSGGHADQSWHICPECGEESSFQHWVTTPP